jgi:hypothetical protein
VNIVTVSQTHIAFHTGRKGAKRIQGLMPRHLLEASGMLSARPSFKSFRLAANYSSEQVAALGNRLWKNPGRGGFAFF